MCRAMSARIASSEWKDTLPVASSSALKPTPTSSTAANSECVRSSDISHVWGTARRLCWVTSTIVCSLTPGMLHLRLSLRQYVIDLIPPGREQPRQHQQRGGAHHPANPHAGRPVLERNLMLACGNLHRTEGPVRPVDRYRLAVERSTPAGVIGIDEHQPGRAHGPGRNHDPARLVHDDPGRSIRYALAGERPAAPIPRPPGRARAGG